MATTNLVTVEDLQDLEDDGHRYDLIRGELIRISPAAAPHGKLSLRIGSNILAYVDEHQLGEVYGAETGFILARNPDVLLAPDAAFVQTSRLPPEEERVGFMEVAPDLVVEVVSPSDLYREVHAKVMEYLTRGVRLVWVVQPESHDVTVYDADRPPRVVASDDALDGGDVLPGFRLPLEEIFR